MLTLACTGGFAGHEVDIVLLCLGITDSHDKIGLIAVYLKGRQGFRPMSLRTSFFHPSKIKN